MVDTNKILLGISNCDDPNKLRSWITNARAQGEIGVADAAFRRLISLVPSEKPGTVEHDFWRMVHAYEFFRSEENGRTTRLSRTRQKVDRVGVIETLKDWAISSKDTAGFTTLLGYGMPEFTGEAIVLRHPEKFDATILAAAKSRLIAAGVDLNKLGGIATS